MLMIYWDFHSTEAYSQYEELAVVAPHLVVGAIRESPLHIART